MGSCAQTKQPTKLRAAADLNSEKSEKSLIDQVKKKENQGIKTKQLNQHISPATQSASQQYEQKSSKPSSNINIKKEAVALQSIKLDSIGYTNRAAQKLQSGKYKEAVEDYTSALALDSHDRHAYQGRALAYNNCGQYDLALQDFERCISMCPRVPELYMQRGITKTCLRRYVEAEADHSNCLKIIEAEKLGIGVLTAEALCHRGLARHYQGREEDALADFARALEVSPKASLAYINMGLVKRAQGHLDEAISAFGNASKYAPRDNSAYYNRGLVYMQQKNYPYALEDFKRAVECDSTFVAAMYQRGLARLRLGLHREAAHDFGKCIELDSKYAKALLGKGLAKMAHGDTDEAITSFTECLALDGRLSAARYQRAVLYTLREQYAEALSDLDACTEILTTKTGSTLGSVRAGFSSVGVARQDSANQTLLQSKNISFQKNMPEIQQGIAAIAAKKYPASEETMADLVDVYWQRGEVLLGMTRLNEALEAYDQAIALHIEQEAGEALQKNEKNGITKQQLNQLSLQKQNTIASSQQLINNEEKKKKKQRLCLLYCRRGLTNYRLNNLQEAIGDFDQALQIDAHCREALNNRGSAKEALGRVHEAISDFSLAIDQDNSCSESYSNRGFAFKKLGYLREAIGDYTRAIELDARNQQAVFNRGVALLALGLYDDALIDFTNALKLDKNDAEAYLNRANAKAGLGQQKEALEDYQQAMALDERLRATVYFKLGQLHYTSGFYKSAVQDFTRCLGLEQQHAQALLQRALALQQLEQWRAAANDQTAALELLPLSEHAQVYMARATCLYALGDYEGAADDLSRCIENSSKVTASSEEQPKKQLAHVHFRRAACYKRVARQATINFGVTEKALNDYLRTIELHATHPRAHSKLGALLLELERYAEAIEHLSQALALNSADKKVYYNRAMAKQALNQHAEAVQDFEQCLKIDTKHKKAWFYCAKSRFMLRQSPRAIEDLNQAIAIDDKYAEAYLQRGTAYVNLLSRHAEGLADLTICLRQLQSRSSNMDKDKVNGVSNLTDTEKTSNLILNYSARLQRAKALHELQRHSEALGDCAVAIEHALCLPGDGSGGILITSPRNQRNNNNSKIAVNNSVLNDSGVGTPMRKNFNNQTRWLYEPTSLTRQRAIGEAHFLSARCHFVQGHYSHALEHCNSALEQQSKRADLLQMRGLCYKELGKTKEAVEDLKAALWLEHRRGETGLAAAQKISELLAEVIPVAPKLVEASADSKAATSNGSQTPHQEQQQQPLQPSSPEQSHKQSDSHTNSFFTPARDAPVLMSFGAIHITQTTSGVVSVNLMPHLHAPQAVSVSAIAGDGDDPEPVNDDIAAVPEDGQDKQRPVLLSLTPSQKSIQQQPPSQQLIKTEKELEKDFGSFTASIQKKEARLGSPTESTYGSVYRVQSLSKQTTAGDNNGEYALKVLKTRDKELCDALVQDVQKILELKNKISKKRTNLHLPEHVYSFSVQQSQANSKKRDQSPQRGTASLYYCLVLASPLLGCSLETIICKQSEKSQQRVSLRTLAAHCLHALSVLHGNGFAHLNIKLENVLVYSEFSVEIADPDEEEEDKSQVESQFLLCDCTYAQQIASEHFSDNRLRAATLAFMAPELRDSYYKIGGDEDSDNAVSKRSTAIDLQKCDVYSLGAVLLCTAINMPTKKMIELRNAKQVLDSAVLKGVKNERARDVIAQMLLAEPQKRPTLQQIVHLLDAFA